MNSNYVLIDFENVQALDPPKQDGHVFKLIYFHGLQQTKVSRDLLINLQSLGKQVEHVVVQSSGQNALDFVLAAKLGELISQDSNAWFHIISKDKNFDSLVTHMVKSGFKVTRCARIADIPCLRNKQAAQVAVKAVAKVTAPTTKSTAMGTGVAADVKIALTNLAKMKAAKPNKWPTLISSLKPWFSKYSPKQLDELATALLETRRVIRTGDKISYKF